MIKTVVRVGLLLLVGVVVATYLAVSKYATKSHWETGTARIAGRHLSITVGDWPYVAAGSVPVWTDRQGEVHTDTWPNCLPDGEKSVRFAWVKVTVNGTGLRPIVAIDCRG